MSKISCVYAIVNIRNGKRYVGSTANFTARIQMHRFHLRRGSHNNRHLQASWKKYGEDAFIFGIIEEVPIDQLINQEQAQLDAAQPRVYNLGKFVATPSRGRTFKSPFKGKKLSKETIARMRTVQQTRANAGRDPFRNLTAAQKQRWRASLWKAAVANTGQKRSDNTKALLRAAWENRKKNLPTHCKRGHEYLPENIKVVKGAGRRCLTCAKANFSRWYTKSHMPKTKVPLTQCRNGHAYTPENTYLYRSPKTGKEVRMCVTCRKCNAALALINSRPHAA